MPQDFILQYIVNRLKTKYGCHTVLLYGSRSRGGTTIHSDYDVLGVSSRVNKVTREARKFRGKYLDLFVYPTSKLKKVGPQHVHMQGGQVLFEKNEFGSSFLKRLDKVFRKGPKKLPRDESQARRVWALKMFDRSCGFEIEDYYRRLWLIVALLEDYFVLRGQWFLGLRLSLNWLKSNDTKTYNLFAKVLKNPRDHKAVKKLIFRVIF